MPEKGFVRILYIDHTYFDSEALFVIETEPNKLWSKNELLKKLAQPHDCVYLFRTIRSTDVFGENGYSVIERIYDGEGTKGEFIFLWYNDAAKNGIID